MTKHLRLRRILAEDGRALVVALDRPRALLTRSLSEPRNTLSHCRASDVDAVIVPLGTLRTAVDHFGSMAVILSVREGIDVVEVVDTALRLGADAIKYEAFPGGPAERFTMPTLEALGRRCDRAGVPLLAEMIPHSFEAIKEHTADAVAAAARVGMECGADIVKVPQPSDADLSAVVSYAGIPVVALGGPVIAPDSFLESAAAAMRAGAVGLAVGRNVFESPDPIGTARSLRAIIHPRTFHSSSPQ